jgi:hypothetical protein
VMHRYGAIGLRPPSGNATALPTELIPQVVMHRYGAIGLRPPSGNATALPTELIPLVM